MSRFRLWLFRGLVVMASGLMLLTWFIPWWNCNIFATEGIIMNAVQIYPYGLVNNLGYLDTYIKGSAMPVWFAPLMWAYLGLCIALLLFSLFARERTIHFGRLKLLLPQLLIGVIGFSYIVVVILAVIIAAIRTGDFYGTHLVGKTAFEVTGFVKGYVSAGLQFGYWLACAIGPLLIILALVRNKIIGKPKLSV